MMPPIINQPARAHLWQLWNSSLLLMLFPWTHLKSSSPWKAPSKITGMIFITIFFDNNHADVQVHHNHGQYLHVHHHHDQRHHHDLLFLDLPQTAWRSNYGETPRRWRRACLQPRWSWWYQGGGDRRCFTFDEQEKSESIFMTIAYQFMCASSMHGIQHLLIRV